MRAALFGGALVIIGAALAIVPLPFVVFEPAPVIRVPPRVAIADSPDEINGTYLLTAVQLQEPSAVDAVAAAFDDTADVAFAPTIVPAGMDEEDFIRLQRELFRESARIAAAVGLREAGLDVQVMGQGARVAFVIPRSPADDVLEQGDVIVGADGQRIDVAAELAAVTARAEAGDEITLEVRRGDETLTPTIEVRRVDRLGRAGIGVVVESVSPEIQLPVEVDVEQGEVGGPSGGLMLALTFYDLAAEANLADGRRIAGTGTISLAGTVGAVGEVDLKVAAARRADADIFLVPESQADEARRAAGDELEVIPVSTFDEALAALRR